MLVQKGNLLNPPLSSAGLSLVDAVCVTTNLQCRNDGTAVMGGGIALYAHEKWDLDRDLGYLLKMGKKSVVIIKEWKGMSIVAVPTKDHWRNPSTLELVSKSLDNLVSMTDCLNWQSVWVPSMGTGLGGLHTSVVWPLMHKKLDDRFTMILKG